MLNIHQNNLNKKNLKNNHYKKKNNSLKPKWIRIKLPTKFNHVNKLKNILRKYELHTVCEEARCPNLTECFHNHTATFMILGNICTRKCSFCAVKKGRPILVDPHEPEKLSKVVDKMGIKYIVITSVNRDDLKDGGATQFSNCIHHLRKKNENIKIEILVPDFRNSLKYSIDIISKNPPDVFNHNIENVPRLYQLIRPGANYYQSLKLLQYFKKKHPNIFTKSGLMLGLGETEKEVLQVLQDLRNHDVNMLTLGQYLQPTQNHIPIKRYVTPLEFQHLYEEAISMGFTKAFCGPLVRSSYHANEQVK
ncbi:lipoyl synthase [Buchnera aphidicola]|uniref:lipoyl synthase n=1 Tax=Buchnera aphidicola TaxID=9 RepID=UPI003464A7DF